ncbi:MAG: glycoside hydrolase family 25 protein [Lachnospiraceae bacterium]|jgi:GH25 family lysozyme M1 (1,4-beta-N-acetylmuramidase)|nr:glycoside hydrolase family 25 protein [Lachnospiraceae bacterium]
MKKKSTVHNSFDIEVDNQIRYENDMESAEDGYDEFDMVFDDDLLVIHDDTQITPQKRFSEHSTPASRKQPSAAPVSRNQPFTTTTSPTKEEKRPRKRSVMKTLFAILGCLTLLSGVVYGAYSLYQWMENQVAQLDKTSDAIFTQADLDAAVAAALRSTDSAIQNAKTEATAKEAERILGGIAQGLSAGVTTVETLRPFYTDKIVVVSNGLFHFVPIQEQLQKHTLRRENLVVLESGEYQYWVDGELVSKKGIDVSHHQGAIDWDKVKAAGVEFAIIRVGYRGYGSEGRMMPDTQFLQNIEGAIAAGIEVGVYYFSQAITPEEAIEEAEYMLEQIAPYELTYPVVLDVEKVGDSQGRMNLISVEERTAIVKTFLDRIATAGYDCMMYHNTEMGALLVNIAELEAYDKWYAYYGDDLFYPYKYKIWQYSEKGRIDGIEGDVDLNISLP